MQSCEIDMHLTSTRHNCRQSSLTGKSNLLGDEFVWRADMVLNIGTCSIKKTVFFQCNDANDKSINALYKIAPSANSQKVHAQKKALQNYQSSLASKTAMHIAWQLANQMVQELNAFLTDKELVEAGNDQLNFKIIEGVEVHVCV